MQIKIAICDDEEKALKKLEKQIIKIATKLKFSPEIYMYNEGKRMVDLICSKEETFDILFLDINIPDLSGIQIAKKIREAKLDIILIFVSAHEEYVFESIKYNPFRYIRKNKMDKELGLALKAALALIKSQMERMYVLNTDMGYVRLKHSDIMYFETEDRKAIVSTKDGNNYSIQKSIRGLHTELNDDVFLQIHSGGVVNVAYIAAFSNMDITLENGHSLNVSRRRFKEVKNIILSYWR